MRSREDAATGALSDGPRLSFTWRADPGEVVWYAVRQKYVDFSLSAPWAFSAVLRPNYLMLSLRESIIGGAEAEGSQALPARYSIFDENYAYLILILIPSMRLY